MSLLIGIACFLAAGGVVWGSHRSTPLLRLRRSVKRDIEEIDDEVEACERVTSESYDRLRSAASEYVEHGRDARLAEVPIEALRDAGARNVQWSALRDGGFETLADVAGKSALTLERARGVGETSAERVADAAREVVERMQREPVPLPKADLPTPADRALGASALDVLDAQDALGAAPHELGDHAATLREQVSRMDAKAGFWRWLFGKQSAGYLVPEYFEGKAVRAKVRADLEEELFRDVAERRSRVLAQERTDRDAPDLVDRFRARYADASALIESVLPGAAEATDGEGLPSHPLARHLPIEIAQAVEAFPLRVEKLGVTLRRYQEFGAKYVLHQRRTILGDEMGLGKTIEALAAIVHCHDAEGARHFLVVAPASITRNWEREIAKRTQLTSSLWHGSGRAHAADEWLASGGIALVSFSTLRRMDIHEKMKAKGTRLGLLVVDEAHYVKNPEASRTQAVGRLLPRAERICFMSGTPMENHPQEFCTLVDALRPEVAEKLRGGGSILGDVVVEAQRFHALVSPVYLRRNQEDVLRELPPKVEFEEWVDVGSAQLAAYRDAVLERNLMAMRQAVTASEESFTSAKMARLQELLEEHAESGRKVVVFSYFLQVLAEVAERFGAVGSITGSVAGDTRMALIDDFQGRDGHALLACQIQAGGVGVNLQAASVVVLMEPQWKPSTEAQAIARAHRMGQTDTVLVHRMLARDTVDERIVAILEGKLDLFQQYARESLVKRASKEATEPALAELVLAYETERLAAG